MHIGASVYAWSWSALWSLNDTHFLKYCRKSIIWSVDLKAWIYCLWFLYCFLPSSCWLFFFCPLFSWLCFKQCGSATSVVCNQFPAVWVNVCEFQDVLADVLELKCSAVSCSQCNKQVWTPVMHTFGLMPLLKVWTSYSPSYGLVPFLYFYEDDFGIK